VCDHIVADDRGGRTHVVDISEGERLSRAKVRMRAGPRAGLTLHSSTERPCTRRARDPAYRECRSDGWQKRLRRSRRPDALDAR